MSNVCAQHTAKPARIYDSCVGCEIEELREQNIKLKSKLDLAVHMLLLTASDDKLNDIKELGNMAKETLGRMGIER